MIEIIVIVVLASIVTVLAMVIGVFLVTVFVGAPYVPSHRREVRKAFTTLRPLNSDDVVVDLGSGDGVVLQEALTAGAQRAIGYEINPLLVWLSRRRLRKLAGAQVLQGNFWRVQPPEDVSIVYAFTVGRDASSILSLVQRWANEANRAIDFIVYAHELPTGDAPETHGAHHKYTIRPLQSE